MYSCEEGEGGEALVRVRGSLDPLAARELRELIEHQTSRLVILNLSEADESDYCGLAVLLRELRGSRSVVRLSGVVARQIRMIRYFGLEPVQFGIEEAGP